MAVPRARAKIHPVIVVPAITATGLVDQYPLSPVNVWSASKLAMSEYSRMMLCPRPPTALMGSASTGVCYETQQPTCVRPTGAFGLVYDDLIADLRHNLSYDDIPVQPVYTFAYDWRQDNFITIRRLAAFIDEVIERTRMMPHDGGAIEGEVCDAVDLIGHSMGGCVIAGCVASGLVGQGALCKVRRVVTLGAPFKGAAAALTKLASGLGTLTGRGAKERERAAARVTPSVYQLLPTYHGAGVWRGAESMTVEELLGVVAEQPAILETIARVLWDHDSGRDGVDANVMRGKAEQTLADLLRSTRAFQTLVGSVDPLMLRWGAEEGDVHVRTTGAWLAIVGAGERTQISAGVGLGATGGATFDFSSGYSREGWDGVTWDTGDETVPLESATPPWMESWKQTVVVERGDFSWPGEMGDGVLAGQLGFHSTLPLLNLAQRWIVNFLRPHWSSTRGYHQHGRLWGRQLPSFWESAEGATMKLAVSAMRTREERNARLAEHMRGMMQGLIPGVAVESPPNGWPTLR